jgi:hypothetical protein
VVQFLGISVTPPWYQSVTGITLLTRETCPAFEFIAAKRSEQSYSVILRIAKTFEKHENLAGNTSPAI